LEIENLFNDDKGSLQDEIGKEMFFKSQTCQDFIRQAETWLTNYQQLDAEKQEKKKELQEEITRILRLVKEQKATYELPLENP